VPPIKWFYHSDPDSYHNPKIIAVINTKVAKIHMPREPRNNHVLLFNAFSICESSELSFLIWLTLAEKIIADIKDIRAIMPNTNCADLYSRGIKGG
jgi:hypothetical protein